MRFDLDLKKDFFFLKKVKNFESKIYLKEKKERKNNIN